VVNLSIGIKMACPEKGGKGKGTSRGKEFLQKKDGAISREKKDFEKENLFRSVDI